MDMTYWYKRAMGTLTSEEEQAYRAKQAAEELRATPVQPAAQPAYGATQVMPGNALRERQDVLDYATKELRGQDTMRGIKAPPVQPMTPEEEERARRNKATFFGVRG